MGRRRPAEPSHTASCRASSRTSTRPSGGSSQCHGLAPRSPDPQLGSTVRREISRPALPSTPIKPADESPHMVHLPPKQLLRGSMPSAPSTAGALAEDDPPKLSLSGGCPRSVDHPSPWLQALRRVVAERRPPETTWGAPTPPAGGLLAPVATSATPRPVCSLVRTSSILPTDLLFNLTSRAGVPGTQAAR